MATLLTIRNIDMNFGGLQALKNLNLSILEGEIHSLIGPNGAGKTTVFNLITGVYPWQRGEILFLDSSLSNLAPHQICRLGIARTFQNIRLFKALSVLDNVRVTYHPTYRSSLQQALMRSTKFKLAEEGLMQQAEKLLKIFDLHTDAANTLAGSLAYGKQRELEIARALATQPKLLLLDEPAAGMNQTEKVALMQTISKLREQFHLTILLIDHDMRLVMGISDRVTVLDHGEMIAQGQPASIRKDPRVIEAYLGVSDAGN